MNDTIHASILSPPASPFPQMARQHRAAAGMSVRQAARKLGISAMHLSHLERDQRRWTPRLQRRWERVMKRAFPGGGGSVGGSL